MKAQQINRSLHQHHSFLLESHNQKNFMKVWHCHAALELVIIKESTGTRFVGDCVERFESGEIVLLGKDLPHLWLNDKAYFEKNSKLLAKAHVIHFHEDFAGGLFKIPEMMCIHDMLERARRGIKFEDRSNPSILEKVENMFDLNGYERVLSLLDLLESLSRQKKYRLLASSAYMNSFKGLQNSKIVRVNEFIMTHFKDDISLGTVADLANMNPSAFSRYFRNVHNKTFVRYLNEIRVGYACKLLTEDRYNIAEVCFESGFNNISNFNRQFKSLVKMPPSEYVRHYSRLVQ